MSYIIEKAVGNSIYLYEVTSFWDPEKKQSRQKRTYLGKKDPETGQPIRPRSHRPRLSKDYGNVYLLQHVADRIGLSHLLKQVFSDDYHTILALTFFEISEAQPLYLFPYWVESTWLPEVPSLPPKALTTLTRKLGRMESERLEFSKQWVKKLGAVHAVVFDITSLSSYSAFLDYIEWGYNRDCEQLPQLNLGVIYAEQTNLPLYYRIYPGSISDVSTLKNLVKYLNLFALQEILFIMDRGFYSASNIEHLEQNQMTFLIPLPMSVKHFSRLRAKHARHLSNPMNSFRFKDEVLYHIQDSIEINQVQLQAHLYFDPRCRSEKTTHFLKKILDIEHATKQHTFQTQKEAKQYLSKNFRGASKLFRVTGKAGHIEITRKPRTLSRRMANMGTTIMLTNHPTVEHTRVLELYRHKDYLEKLFDMLKNEFDGKRLRGSTKDTVEGRLFLKFLSLILYSALSNTMREQHLFKRYSIRELMYELKKLRIVAMSNDTVYLTEVSKRQRKIFENFDVTMPSIET
jgi:transposase